MRAVRRTGEILATLERAPTASGGDTAAGGRGAQPVNSPYAHALKAHRIPIREANDMQAVARVPAAEFEAA